MYESGHNLVREINFHIKLYDKTFRIYVICLPSILQMREALNLKEKVSNDHQKCSII